MITPQVKVHRKKNFALTAQMHEHAVTLPDYSGREIYTDPHRLVQAIIEVQDIYDFDLPVLGYDVYNIEPEALGKEITYSENGAPQQDSAPLIEDEEDIDRLKLPDRGEELEERGRFDYILQATELFQKRTNTLPYLQFCAPFSLAARLVGFEKLITSLISSPAFVHELMERVTEKVLIPWIELQQSKFPAADIFLGADALASPPNLTPDMLEEFVLPYIRLLKRELGEGIGIVNWWGESHVRDLEHFLDLKRKVSPHSRHLRVQDPDLYHIEPERIIDYVREHDMHLTLGVSARLLIQGSRREIKNRMEKYVPLCRELPHLTIYLCNLGRDTPPENIRAAVSAAREIHGGQCGGVC